MKKIITISVVFCFLGACATTGGHMDYTSKTLVIHKQTLGQNIWDVSKVILNLAGQALIFRELGKSIGDMPAPMVNIDMSDVFP